MFYWELKKVILNLLQIKVLVQKRTYNNKICNVFIGFLEKVQDLIGIEGDTAKLTCEKRV